MSISSEMNRKLNFGIVNTPDGLFMSVNGKKYYFMKNSDTCNLMRSIILPIEKEIEVTIQSRQIKDGVKYTKTNEHLIKQTFKVEDMKLNWEEKEGKEKEEPVVQVSSKINVKKVGKKLYMPVNLRNELKKCIPGDYDPLDIDSICEETLKSKVISEKTSIKHNIVKNDVEEIPVNDEKEEKVENIINKEEDNNILETTDNTKSDTTDKDIIIGGMKITEQHIKIFKEIKAVCDKLGIVDLTRDKAAENGIKYRRINNGRWGITREQYQEYNKKYM